MNQDVGKNARPEPDATHALAGQADKDAAATAETDAVGRWLQEQGFERSTRFGTLVWKGRPDGRGIVITISRVGRTRYAGEVRYRQHLGYRARIEVETSVPARCYFVPRSTAQSSLIQKIYRWKRQLTINAMPACLSEHRAVVRDEAWGRSLVADTRAMEDVAELIADPTGQPGSVYFHPGHLQYTTPILQHADFTPDRMVETLRRMARLAAAAEALPPPQVPDRPSRLEGLARERPLAAAFLFLGGFLAFLMLFGIAIAVLLWLVAR